MYKKLVSINNHNIFYFHFYKNSMEDDVGNYIVPPCVLICITNLLTFKIIYTKIKIIIIRKNLAKNNSVSQHIYSAKRHFLNCLADIKFCVYFFAVPLLFYIFSCCLSSVLTETAGVHSRLTVHCVEMCVCCAVYVVCFWQLKFVVFFCF